MNLLHALIFGAVEGITEFIPISSTGHLILTAKILGIAESEFVKSFEIIIQLGAILAVVVLYFKTFFRNIEALKRIIVAFIPTGILGLAFYKLVKTYLLGNSTVVLSALFIGGIIIVLFELFHREPAHATELRRVPHEAHAAPEIEKISYRKAFFIGVFQSIAMVPGVSRSAATIIGGLFLGLKRTAATEFSFLVAVPTMAAATGLDLVKNASSFSFGQIDLLLVGFAVSFFVALLSVRLLLKFVKTHTFLPFGVYRIVAAAAFWLLVL